MRRTRLTFASLFAIVVVLAAGGSSPAMAKATKNLIKNPGAENGPASPAGDTTVGIPSWTQAAVDESTVIAYGTAGTSHGMPGPSHRGTQLWYGGVNTGTPDLHQTIPLSKYVARISRGGVKFEFAGYFGGFDGNDDTTGGLVTFENSHGHELKAVRIGDPTSADRGTVSKMLFDSASGKVPAKTVKVTVDLIFTFHDGGSNDGYADNLSLKFL